MSITVKIPNFSEPKRYRVKLRKLKDPDWSHITKKIWGKNTHHKTHNIFYHRKCIFARTSKLKRVIILLKPELGDFVFDYQVQSPNTELNKIIAEYLEVRACSHFLTDFGVGIIIFDE